MMVGILYGSTKKLTKSHKLVSNHGSPPANGAKKQPDYFVRMKVVSEPFESEFALAEALDLARPMKGETVLNTVFLCQSS